MKFLVRDRLPRKARPCARASALPFPYQPHLQFSRLESRFLANSIISFSACRTERGMRKGPRFPSNQSINATNT
jgi:hypothetical protein